MKTIIKSLIMPALLTTAVAANAATLTFTDTFSWVGSGSDTLVLSQFDSSLGTLTGVTITFYVDKTGGLAQADNDSDVEGSISFTQSVSAIFETDDVSLVTTDLTAVDTSLSADSISGELTLEATTGDSTDSFDKTDDVDYVEWDPTDASDSSSASISEAAWEAGDTGYIGTGNFSITVSGTQSTTTNGLGGVQSAQVVSSVSGYASVTYEYTPVPEPSTYAAFIGFAALALACIRRRK
jgi:hypothetical protein